MLRELPPFPSQSVDLTTATYMMLSVLYALRRPQSTVKTSSKIVSYRGTGVDQGNDAS